MLGESARIGSSAETAHAPGASSQSCTPYTGCIGMRDSGGAKSSWCRRSAPGRIRCRCFASVVLPEHVEPEMATMKTRGGLAIARSDSAGDKQTKR